MYCPLCLQLGLTLNSNGVATLYVNKKHLDNGRFLFNVQAQSKQEIFDLAEKKLKEFMQWYSRFQNIQPIETIEILSNNFNCPNKCKLSIDHNFSVLDILIPSQKFFDSANKYAPRYNLVIKLKKNNGKDEDDEEA